MARPSTGNSKADLAARIAEAVGAGKPVKLDTVDFNDPNRAKTCLEVDFPILPVNQVAAIEGNAGKPIYQMSKWWARRRSSVFRSMLIAAATKAPDDPAEAAKHVWKHYYANHQKRGAFKHLKVADIFMGGGTTIVEGARLGMQMYGNDLNPVAWFIVKNEMAQVSKAEVEALLADIEAEVKPAIQPFYTCDCPRGHKGAWTDLRTGKRMPAEFRGWQVPVEERRHFKYEGPEIIYVFWAKHGPCQVTGCGHRTPLFSSPVMAIKTLTVKAWERTCPRPGCGTTFDVEMHAARMAPGVAQAVAPGEKPFAVMDDLGVYNCPGCRAQFQDRKARESGTSAELGKAKNKKVTLSLLVHPQWQAGEAGVDEQGRPYGGSVTDDAESTARWNQVRARKIRLLEVRGALPAEVTCPKTELTFSTESATITKHSNYACGACGTVQDVLTTVKRSGKSGPVAAYAIQGYCADCDDDGRPYGGRFFMPLADTAPIDAALTEWAARRDVDLTAWWPRSELPYGFMTHALNGGIPNHGFTHWWTMFNPRQLLTHAQLLRAVVASGSHSSDVRDFVLGAFQQYLRNQTVMCFWDVGYDKLVPALSNNNFHPKSSTVENCVFAVLGRGNWTSSSAGLAESLDWRAEPWEVVHAATVKANGGEAKNAKVLPGDALDAIASLACGSSTDLASASNDSLDLVITDPPFGGLLHYSELSDFFYVWLRLALKDRYPAEFGPEYTPKTLEAVANKARNPGAGEADAWYQKVLTAAWREAFRILKPGGILAFTFHHSEDEPWVAVLESLFDAGFYLEATYPIRSDETKGDGEFGSKKIEYDIIHVCRKRTEQPTFTSWARMRKAILADVRQLQTVLEAHQQQGLPAADLQVIRRGKALEYFSRHYGKVFTDPGKEPMTVQEALAGITDLLDDDTTGHASTLPADLEPMTRQFLRMFQGEAELPRDQVQKYLRGTGIAPSDFEARGWCREVKKVVQIVPPLELAQAWVGKHRKGMTSDYDQAFYLIGACIDGSGINAQDTLNNEQFRAHRTLEPLLDWFAQHATVGQIRIAARRALTLVHAWRAKQVPKPKTQIDLAFEDAA